MEMAIRRCIYLVVGITGFIWFMLPYITYRIMNIGNRTGLAVSTILMLYGVFQPKIASILNRPARMVLMIVIGIVIALVVVMSGLMIKAAVDWPQEDATIVVLGCRVIGERPSLMLEERLEKTYEYMSKYGESVAVLSGGQGADEAISEAECMYRYLTERGIAPDRLYLEDQSTSTRENLLYAYDVIRKNQLNESIAIVTNEFHEYRASKVAESLGVRSGAVSASTAMRLFPTYYVRELYGILYQWVL